MQQYLYLIPALPLIGFLLLSAGGGRFPRYITAIIGAGSVCVSAIVAITLGVQFLLHPPTDGAYHQVLWQWFNTGKFQVDIGLHMDALSLVFICIITFIGGLIHIYSTAFMQHDRDYARFFACMNLFVCAMLLLVMADNLVLLYLGWEGVGLCSFLLIGFWYETPANCQAARKAFVVTRIGDTAMIIGLFLLFRELGTLNIRSILQLAPQYFTTGSSPVTWIAVLLLAGGMGKSAQLPFQTWLPDAMAGPSPVSALIHAATMVTAGVYLIARMHTLFELAPAIMHLTATIGAVTLLIAGCSAIVQTDIKRILAYSTISQIGYMFLALGVGAWDAAIFHFFTHAFFKALLFLAAGAVIETLHHEHNIFRMGGLRKQMPLIFCTFTIGAAALAALPFVTAGFFSKDEILWFAWSAQDGHPALWATGLLGAFITALYSTRLILVVFWGEMKTTPGKLPAGAMNMPLVVLAIFSIGAGWIHLPHLTDVLPETLLQSGHPAEIIFQFIAILTTLLGILTGYLLYYRYPQTIREWQQSAGLMAVRNFFQAGWKFDQLYDVLFVQPFVFLTQVSRNDVIDKLYTGIAAIHLQLSKWFSISQNGSLRWYVAGLLIGILFIITLQLLR
jgi:NADH-quinone oxidoreductase subunit L